MDRSRRSDAAAIKAAVVRVGLERGAGAVRIVAAGEDVATRARLRAAIERGDLSTWRLDEAYARAAADPSYVLAGARSVVCVAVPYATPSPRQRHLRGRVSNYAWSRDYHSRLRPILNAIAGVIDAAVGAPSCVIALDTKPLAERALAARAGIGWIGKNTTLIAPQLGSFVFLGEVVTTVQLPPDAALRKTCGTCERCVQACPTAALRGDYTMDATRCISDLTQRTDGIPRTMRPLVGEWIWGCDICQTSCPPTQQAGCLHDAANAPQSTEAAQPDLIALLGMTSGTFKRTFKGTAMGWRGAAVLRRNAAVALGNALDRSSVPALARALESDPHPMVRSHAAWALGRIGSPAAIAALCARSAEETERDVSDEILLALKQFAPLGG
jgi:epoxyqueuosine reductase